MPDVSWTAPADVRLWVALDVHKHSIVAATLPPAGGSPQVQRIENTYRRVDDRIEIDFPKAASGAKQEVISALDSIDPAWRRVFVIYPR